MKSFVFGDYRPPEGAFVVNMPRGISTKERLLGVLYEELRFPEYFGDNWDALEECIRDFAWLPNGDVVLFNHDLPLAESGTELKIYLSILLDAVKMWDQSKERNLVVVFPSVVKGIVQDLLGNKLPPIGEAVSPIAR